MGVVVPVHEKRGIHFVVQQQVYKVIQLFLFFGFWIGHCRLEGVMADLMEEEGEISKRL